MTSLFTELTGEEDIDLRREAVEQIKPLYDLMEQKRAFEKGIKLFDGSPSDYGAMGPLRRWLYDHPGERLEDPETGLVAYLKPGGKVGFFEPAAMLMDKAPDLFKRLVMLGCVDVNPTKVKDAVKEGKVALMDVERWMHDGERTPRLEIRRA